MLANKSKANKDSFKTENNKPTIYVTKIVKDACSVYIDKGRYHSTASKLSNTKNKCVRMAR
jgi:hypothetical protein